MNICLCPRRMRREGCPGLVMWLRSPGDIQSAMEVPCLHSGIYAQPGTMTNFTFSTLTYCFNFVSGKLGREAIVSEGATFIFRQFCVCVVGSCFIVFVFLPGRSSLSFSLVDRQCPVGFTPLLPIHQTLAGHHRPFPPYTSHIPPFLQRAEVRHLLNIFKRNKSQHLQIYELGIQQQPFPQS